MYPGAAINANDQFLAAPGTLDPRQFPAPNLPPPDPTLGDRMRNRNWWGREQEAYYQMAQAPQPWQYSRDAAHPRWGGGSGNAIAQYHGPAGPPTGFAARRAPTIYSDPRAGTAALVRPTAAYNYNRVPGRGRMLQYANSWPNQFEPGGSNTYIPVWEATGLVIKYTRNPAYFRINRYVKDIKIPKDMGYYLTLDADAPYRVVNTNDYLWSDTADAPGGRQERQGFGFVNYMTARYCYPFNLGRKAVVQAEWPILAEHAAMASAKAMTVRTMLSTTLAANVANWTFGGTNNYGPTSAQWSQSGSTSPNPPTPIQADFNSAMIAIEQGSGGIVTDEEALHVTMNPTLARNIARGDELRSYIKGSPDALAAITDWRNPNRRYGLAPFIYGIGAVVENAVVVTTPKPANVASPAATNRQYVWQTGNVVFSSRPEGIVQSDEQTLDFSTFCFRFYEQMTVESKSDPDNRREVGRVVEDFVVRLQSPQTGFLYTGAS